MTPGVTRPARIPALLRRLSMPTLFLLIEFFDELTYGAQGVALPALRADLGLSYAQVGLMLGLPSLLSAVLEPGLMLLGDTGWRRSLMLGGGVVVAVSLFAFGSAHSFAILLMALALNYPASGAFVTLSQASLVELRPGREAHSMARWSAAGSLGSLLGPLVLAAGFALGLGWRWAFLSFSALGLGLVGLTLIHPFTRPLDRPATDAHLAPLLRNLRACLRNRGLLRWIFLLQLSDLMLDILPAYLALYFAEVVGFTPAQTGVILGGVMLATLVADLAVVPLMERFPGRTIVRASAGAVVVLYPVWLLLPSASAKVVLVIVIRLLTLGWYQVLQGEAYASEPGRSGTVMALGSVSSVLNSGLAWAVGWAAGLVGLPLAMWLLLFGPLSLLLLIPRRRLDGTIAPVHPESPVPTR
jgi:FSR family fosmidomycin resistance protein-like MFS transporter